MKKIMFTGGGSAGHVTVNIALIPRFLQEGWSVEYIGSENGIEKQLVSALSAVRYHGIATGKLRRYFDWQNVKDPFKVAKGVLQAYLLIKRQKPNVIFSKGGFVSVPVVLGAWLNKVPFIIHESDVTPGLANRLSIPFATGVCTTFPDTETFLPKGKNHYVGPVVRQDLKLGSADRGRQFCQFTDNKPVLLIMGGSLGSRKINETIRTGIDELTKRFQIVHLCGKGQIDSSIHCPEYKQYEYLNEELADVLAMTDVVISRAGANSIFELLALRKPMLLIPLPKEQSRGDQLLNAASFKKSGFCEVLFEEHLTVNTMISEIVQLFGNRQAYIKNMGNFEQKDALSVVFELIKQSAK
ncbi:undecaprenyldiphospho-muramoylpentapeptide beta-N-acetylglucosaminyltransferase [Paenibacillus beijingensis]|uniref:UDP-N-acetylglucosamine--N-acetylmuramyl-(pentapeptide) pyrophosphoryl-undecaprenol N-acetylglucosamine transferase n=1 Tax=Paenibacillus beijingensis TaxID=1126833 RepID=A0A0D5NK68_9BACL|nr:undecaprenyldiphospho-muramoylpentapeptide beta-N-acetylglucosaminyltransferase [Paenibacillus beijingensis]AJY75626.1 UDP-diphospho-muramoylpentapeptide beta-N- acetylglucosaminyltransferase [Paenibacillus beijingensis]